MEYAAFVPRSTDTHSESQDDFLNNFRSLNDQFGQNHIPMGNSVEEATLTNPCVITSTNHRLQTGDQVTFTNLKGLNSDNVIEEWSLNTAGLQTITKVDDDSFSVNGYDATTQPTYTLNTGDWSSSAIDYGFHLMASFPEALSTLLLPPKAAMYTVSKDVSRNLLYTNLAFSNFLNQSSQKLITDLTATRASVQSLAHGFTFQTPWGFKILFQLSTVQSKNFTTTRDFVEPFSSQIYCIVGGLWDTGPVDEFFLGIVSLTQYSIQLQKSVLFPFDTKTYVYYLMAIGV